jgi:PrtD family type I secretion system ABC transporter
MRKANALSRAVAECRGGFVTAIVFSFFINLLAFVGPLYMLQVYDRVLTSRSEVTLVLLTIIAAFLLISFGLLERARSAVLIRLGARFDRVAREDLFGAAVKTSLNGPSSSPSQVFRDLDVVREFLTGTGLISFCDVPWVPIFVAACFVLHPYFGMVATAGAVVILLLALGNELLTRGHLRAASLSSTGANHWITSALRNVEVLYSMGMVGPLRSRWEARHEEVLGHQARASDRAGRFVAMTKFVRAFLQIAILGTGAYLVVQQELSAGAMIAASIIMGRALAPVEASVAHWKGFVNARSSRRRLIDLLDALSDEQSRIQLPEPRGQLSVENATVAPPGQRTPTLRGLSFDLMPGQVLGVIGPSAAGKSTLARALVGVWQPIAGAVRLDGAELAHWRPDQLGRYIGYLPQDIELFEGTVAENIARFSTESDEAVVEAAMLAGVHEMVQLLPQGYNTRVADQGAALSGGQRQRIGLARAFFRKPAVIVLDEPNSNLDAEGEAALISGIESVKASGSTVIIITHKTNVLGVADKILVLKNGQIQQYGDRQAVLGKLMGPRITPINQGIAS